MRILISGASIAGPVLAYWLSRYGFTVTVVEKSPVLRKTGGHAVDLFKPSLRISELMGVRPRIEAAVTGTERMTTHSRGRSTTIELSKLFTALSDAHAEIMRDDLSEIYYDTTTDDVEYLFGDSITALTEDGGAAQVSFEHGPDREFDLVIGADGLRSHVRRLVFGEVPEHFLGGYFGVVSAPKEIATAGDSTGYLEVGRVAANYTADHITDARVVFLFHSEPLDYHHRDTARQRQLVRDAFAGLAPEVDRWLAELDHSPAFYFDSLTQLQLDTWSRGRVTLVGDAGYCPGPAVGGSTSLAVVGAYVLAGELAKAGGDHTVAFPAYERAMGENVRNSRAFAVRAARTVVPATTTALWGLTTAARVINALPTPVARGVAKLSTRGLRLHDSMPVPDYPAPRALQV